ncbi:uncharacterized protein METZ01_LOCUS85824, partial [marine metagenome]
VSKALLTKHTITDISTLLYYVKKLIFGIYFFNPS